MIIGICGEIGAGKTTLANMIVQRNNYVKLSFAGRFKKAMCELFGWDMSKMSQYEYKDGTDFVTGKIRRELMQKFATDYIREQIDPLFHTKMVSLDTEEALVSNNLVVYDDVRHEDEDEFIHKIGGKIIRVLRSANQYTQSSHKSEGVSLHVDMIILNDSYKEHMYNQLKLGICMPCTDKEVNECIKDTYFLLSKYIDSWKEEL